MDEDVGVALVDDVEDEVWDMDPLVLLLVLLLVLVLERLPLGETIYISRRFPAPQYS